ncbi:hypothetical protein [Roseateles violae]|uniref:Uncharacterized protein n=1 Tax=Roseateles violae TaxID=3058042 RepID=A0ABT8DMC3_9BURK|nr:hypothetical protein [Pelomonas sp. PFR6]MDN3919557.1 hypothetical protein [Pelomonas sp. PFR6]
MIGRRALIGGGLGFAGLAGAAAGEADSVVYPRHESLQDARSGYIQALMLMHAALARSGRRYRTRQSESLMVQSRALIELARPEPPIDLFWTMTNPESAAAVPGGAVLLRHADTAAPGRGPAPGTGTHAGRRQLRAPVRQH